MSCGRQETVKVVLDRGPDRRREEERLEEVVSISQASTVTVSCQTVSTSVQAGRVRRHSAPV